MAAIPSGTLPDTGPGSGDPAVPAYPASTRTASAHPAPPSPRHGDGATAAGRPRPARTPRGMAHAISRAAAWWRELTRRQALVAAGALAGLTSLAALGRQPLSWDESVTAAAAERTLPNLARLLTHTDAPLGTYYLLMHYWVRLLALGGLYPSEALLRLPSALAAIGAVLVTTAFTARWWGSRVGLTAGSLLAVQPMFVFYAHDARPYTIATLLAVAATAVLLPALRQPGAGRLAGYTALAVATVYAHLFTSMVLLVHAMVVLRHGRRRWRWLPVAVAVAAAAAPLAWLGHRQIGELGWIPAPTPAGVGSVLFRVGGSAMLVPMVATVLVALRTRRAAPVAGATMAPAGAARVLITAWAVLPPLLLVLADFVQPVLVARYTLMAVPAVAIGTAVVTSRSRRRGAVAALLGTTAAFGLVNAVVQQAQPYKYENYRAAADLVLDNTHPGDGVIFLPSLNRVSFDIYLRRNAEDRASLPTDVTLAANDGPLVASQIAGGDVSAAVISRRIPRYDRLFLVGLGLGQAVATRHGANDLVEERMLASSYRKVWLHRYGEVTVTLFTREPATSFAASP